MSLLKKCSICGATSEQTSIHWNNKYNAFFCKEHINQIYKYGKITNNELSNRKNHNQYNIYEDHAECVMYNMKNEPTGTFIIDIDDVERCKKHRWRIHKSAKGDYIKIATDIGKKHIFLHKYILDYYGNEQIDHINRNTFDNRKSNLRIVSSYVNNTNKESAKSQKQKNGRFKCIFVRYGVQFYLGYFDTKEQSEKAKEDKIREIEENREIYLAQCAEWSKVRSKGISHTPSGKWRADCFINGKQHVVETYESIEDAINARNKYIEEVS